MRNTTHRPAVTVKHRTSLAIQSTNEKENKTMGTGIQYSVSRINQMIDEDEKKAYIEFICRLMARMTIESLRRMMDAAIDEI